MKYLILILLLTSCSNKNLSFYTSNNYFHINMEKLEIYEENVDTIVFKADEPEQLLEFIKYVSAMDIMIEDKIPDESWVRNSWDDNWPKPVIIYNYKNMYNMPNYINWDTIGYINEELKFKPINRI